MVISAVLAIAALGVTTSVALGIDDVEVTVDTWTSDTGRAYVGVRAGGEWSIPAQSESADVSCDTYYGRWRLMGVAQPWYRQYWVSLFACADDEPINPGAPVNVVVGDQPAIGLTAEAYGDLSLYLAVEVAPASAPAGTQRTVSARLTGAWVDALSGYLAAYVDRASLRITGWTVDFGDGSIEQHPADPADPFALSVSHTYEAAGEFTAIVIAHLSGEAYAAFFAPGGAPAERVEPFVLDIANSAAGIGALTIEYTDPVVTVGASPSSPTAPTPVGPADDGSTALWWPRGLRCELYPRAIVVTEGTMTSGGLTLGSGTTRLVGYRYTAGANDASVPTPSGRYSAEAPIRIQWDTPLPDGAAYAVRLELELETTYPDGTVLTSTASGTVEVTVVYSAVGGS